MGSKPCTGQHPDTDRVDHILELFQLQNREALDVWLDDGGRTFEDSIDSPYLQWDNGEYRVKTDEDREAERAAATERKRRYEAGEMEPFEALSYRTMQLYVDRAWQYLMLGTDHER